MKMKYKLIIPLLLLFSMTLFGQGKEEKHEQVKALKVSYITTELNLTSEQSAKFWPVYNEFDEKQFQIRHTRIKGLNKRMDQTGIDKLTDKEATAYLNQILDAEQELTDLRKKMVNDLKAIIGPVKVLKLKKAEDTFNKKLLSKYKDKHKQ